MLMMVMPTRLGTSSSYHIFFIMMTMIIIISSNNKLNMNNVCCAHHQKMYENDLFVLMAINRRRERERERETCQEILKRRLNLWLYTALHKDNFVYTTSIYYFPLIIRRRKKFYLYLFPSKSNEPFCWMLIMIPNA